MAPSLRPWPLAAGVVTAVAGAVLIVLAPRIPPPASGFTVALAALLELAGGAAALHLAQRDARGGRSRLRHRDPRRRRGARGRGVHLGAAPRRTRVRGRRRSTRAARSAGAGAALAERALNAQDRAHGAR